MPESAQERPQRVLDALNRVIGKLFVSGFLMDSLIRVGNRPEFNLQYKYGHQLVLEGLLLALRKFEDLYEYHLVQLLPTDAPGLTQAKQAVEECRSRSLRKLANQMAAHYAENKEDDPLAGEELIDLMKLTGWVEEREVLDWLKPLGLKIIAVRDELSRGISDGSQTSRST